VANGAKRLPPLDLGVEDSLHVTAPWIAQDRAVAGRTRTLLLPSLEPAHDREAHHFVLVAVRRKAEILCQSLIKDAQRVRKIRPTLDRDVAFLQLARRHKPHWTRTVKLGGEEMGVRA
jgi:hypothetical protein